MIADADATLGRRIPWSRGPRRGVRRINGLALGLIALCSTAFAADNSKNFAPDFTELPAHAKILIAPPDVELFSISAGGIAEPRADWTASARSYVRSEMEKRQGQLGVDTVELDEATADEFGELLSLHAAVAQAIAMHHFGPSFLALPTKNGQLEWSCGDALKPLEEKTGARYALFLWVRDGYNSAERTAAIAITAILTLGGVALGHGQPSAYASRVDLDSGRVLWFNRMVRSSGDLREADKAAETVDALLKGFPVAR